MITLIYVDKEGNPFGINKEEYNNIPKIKLEYFKISLTEKDLIPEQYIDTLCIIGCPELGKNEVEIKGIEKSCIGYFWKNDLEWTEGLIGPEEKEEEIKRVYEKSLQCIFLTGKMNCSLKEDRIYCKKRKSLEECPVEKGIPKGAYGFWQVWLKYGGDKNISAEKFLDLNLSDFNKDMLKEISERIKIC